MPGSISRFASRLNNIAAGMNVSLLPCATVGLRAEQ
jgi:hypothetical protein